MCNPVGMGWIIEEVASMEERELVVTETISSKTSDEDKEIVSLEEAVKILG